MRREHRSWRHPLLLSSAVSQLEAVIRKPAVVHRAAGSRGSRRNESAQNRAAACGARIAEGTHRRSRSSAVGLFLCGQSSRSGDWKWRLDGCSGPDSEGHALQAFGKLSAKHLAKHLDRQKEIVARMNPVLVIGRKTAGTRMDVERENL
jgi:hypothetical protein